MEQYYWQGNSIRLRATRREDWDVWKTESFDSESIRLLEAGIELPVTEASAEQLSERFDHFQDKHRIMFTIETLTEEVVGGINMSAVHHKSGTFSFGVRIYRNYRQKGYAEEAVRILLRYGFDELRLQKCNSGCVENNEGSIRLHTKLGFLEEGVRRRTIYTNGQYYDELLFGLTKEEFEENENLL